MTLVFITVYKQELWKEDWKRFKTASTWTISSYCMLFLSLKQTYLSDACKTEEQELIVMKWQLLEKMISAFWETVEIKKRERYWSSSSSLLWGLQSVCISLLTAVSSVCVGNQACPHCLRPARAEGRTGERAGSPYLAQLPLAAAQQGRSRPRAAPLGKVRGTEGCWYLVWVCVRVEGRFSNTWIFVPFLFAVQRYF